MALSKKQWLGVAREGIAGTSQQSPTLYLPAKSKFKNMKKRIFFNEDRNTRDINNEVRDGVKWNEGDIQGAWYNDVHPYFLLAFMGVDSASQPNAGAAPTVWSHAMSLNDNPLPLDLWKGYDSAATGLAYAMAYNVVKSIKFKWQAGESDKGLDVTINTTGFPFAKTTNGLTAAPATPAPTQATTGGTVAAGTYQVAVTYVFASGESAPSSTASVTTTTGTSTITVPSPSSVSGATGWYAYVSQVGGSTLTRQQGSAGTLGVNLVITAPPTSTGSNPPANLANISFSGLVPFGGWQPTIQFSGASSNDIEEMEIDLQQKYTLFWASNGSQTFLSAYPGDREAKINFTARFDNDTLYQKYAGNNAVDDHINVSFQGDLIASTYYQQLVLDFPIVGYDDMEHDTSKDNIKIKGKATARPGNAVNSLFTATVQNTIASYAS